MVCSGYITCREQPSEIASHSCLSVSAPGDVGGSPAAPAGTESERKLWLDATDLSVGEFLDCRSRHPRRTRRHPANMSIDASRKRWVTLVNQATFPTRFSSSVVAHGSRRFQIVVTAWIHPLHVVVPPSDRDDTVCRRDASLLGVERADRLDISAPHLAASTQSPPVAGPAWAAIDELESALKRARLGRGPLTAWRTHVGWSPTRPQPFGCWGSSDSRAVTSLDVTAFGKMLVVKSASQR